MADNIKKIIQLEFQVNNSPVQQFEGTLDEVLAKVADVEEAISTLPEAELKLKVDGVEKTTKELKDLGKQAQTTEKAMDGLGKENGDLSKTFADIYGEALPLTGKLGELEDRLYALAEAGQQGSAEFKALEAEAGRLRRTQIQVDRAVDSASKTISQKLGGALNAAAGAFAVAQGAAGLFGAENEKIEKALLKVQSALAIVNGITAFRENKDDLISLTKDLGKFSKGLGLAIFNMFTFGKASKLAGKEAEGGFASASKGAKGFSVALTATGIGAIIVGIGIALAVVAAYWDDITKAVSGVSASERKSLEDAKANTTEQQRKLDNLNAQDETLRAQGKSEEEILKLKKDQAQKVLDATKLEQNKADQIAKAEIEQSKRNNKILQYIIRAGLEGATLMLRLLALPIDAVIEAVNIASEALGLGKAIDFNINAKITELNEGLAKSAADIFIDPAELEANRKKTLEENENTNIALQNQVDGYGNKIKDLKKKQGEEAAKAAAALNKQIADETKRHNDELLKIADEATKLALEKKKLATKSLLDQLKTDQTLELNALKKGYDDQIKAKQDLDEQLKNQVTTGKSADGTALTKGQIDAIKKQRENLAEEIVSIEANKVVAIDNLNTVQLENTQKLLDEQLKEQQAYKEEVYGLTLELVNAQTELENKALAERLKQYGFTEEEIKKITDKRKAEAGDEFTQNIKKLEGDKAYFDELAKIYKDDTLNQEQRAKEIEKLDKKRVADALANELTILKAKQEGADKTTEEYAKNAARIAEIEKEQAATSVVNTEQAEEEKLAAREAGVEKALELAGQLADLAQALLELETKKVEAEYDKRIKNQENRNNKLLQNDELTSSQRQEIERQNAIELAKIEEEKQEKIKQIQKKQADIDFAITVANIIAQTALAVAKVTGQTGVGAAIAVPLVLASGAIQLATAFAQRQAVQALAMGGMVYGSGGPTDDLVPIMASNGEAVINAAAVRKFAPVLSAINESTGGAPIKPRFAAGGIVSATPNNVNVNNIQDIAAVAGASAVRAYILDSDVTSQSVRNARLAREARIK